MYQLKASPDLRKVRHSMTRLTAKPTPHERRDFGADSYALSVFPTSLGWFGLLGQGGLLVSTFVGHPSENSIRKAAFPKGGSFQIDDWESKLRQSVEAYFEGEVVDFSEVELCLPETTAFRHQVLATTRNLAYGETTSYGELAARVGHPGAARAVGSVMSSNRFPIIIPCHRVLAAGGKLGGYTSPLGVDLKRRLLDIESRQTGAFEYSIYRQ